MALYISYSKKRVENRNLVLLLLSLLKAAGVEKQQILDMRTKILYLLVVQTSFENVPGFER